MAKLKKLLTFWGTRFLDTNCDLSYGIRTPWMHKYATQEV